MAIARIYNFNDLTVRESAKMDAEINNIINFLKGTTQDQLYIVVSDPAAPVLTVSQLSNGNVIQFDLNGTTKTSIDKNGSLTSTLTTGTAPFSIVSTTKCTNLNVGLLDGIDTTYFNSNEALAQFFLGSLQITKLSTGTQSVKFGQDADTFTIKRTSDSANLFSIEDLELDEGAILTFPSTLNLKMEYEPTDEITDLFDVCRLVDVIGDLEEKNIVCGFRSGNLTVGSFIAHYVACCPFSNIIKLRKIDILSSGSVFIQTFTIYKNGVSIGVINTASSSQIVGVGFDLSLVEDDVISVKLSAGAGVCSVSVQFQLTW